MKLSHRRRGHDDLTELSLTSMIDVVFLLLIFFITTSSMMRTERELHVTMDREGRAVVNPYLQRATVEVRPTDGGGSAYFVGRRQFVSVDELRQFLRATFSDAPEGVYVIVHSGVPFQAVAAAVNACEQAELGAVTYVPR